MTRPQSESWRLVAAEGPVSVDIDRAETWLEILSHTQDIGGRFTFWQLPVQDAIVTACVETESEAMREQLRVLAHTDRAPKWHTDISKIAIPPEDHLQHQPYQKEAFAAALATAHTQTLSELTTIERKAAAASFTGVLDRIADAGWQTHLLLDAPVCAVTADESTRPPTMSLVFDTRHEIGYDGRSVTYPRALTDTDPGLLAGMSRAVGELLRTHRAAPTHPKPTRAARQSAARRAQHGRRHG